MKKLLGWGSIAGLLVAVSACDGAAKDKGAAPVEITAKTETIKVDSAAAQRLNKMYGDRLAQTLGAPANAPVVDEANVKASLHKSGTMVAMPMLPNKSLSTLGGAK